MIKEGNIITYGGYKILCSGIHVEWYNRKIEWARLIKYDRPNLYELRPNYYDEILNIKIT